MIGALHGSATVRGNSVGIDEQFFEIGHPAYRVSYSGAAIPRTQLNLPNTSDGTYFVGTYDTHYDQTASLAQFARSYTGTGGTTRGNNPGTNYSISISGTGAVTMPPDAVGCSASGIATPHTDKNVFDLSLRFSGARCALVNGAQVNGIAVVADDGNLLMMGGMSNMQDEFIYVGN